MDDDPRGKMDINKPDNKAEAAEDKVADDTQDTDNSPPKEIGGRDGPDPTRFGDWEKNGRCIDF